MTSKFEMFYDGIFAASPRKFGTLAEIIIQRIENLNDSNTLNYDKLTSDGKRIEIKFSRCSCSKKKSNNIIETIINENNSMKYLPSCTTADFWCNIQQIKPKEFDILYYGIFYTDKIVIYKVSADEVTSIQGFSDKQHRGNIGEGQMGITQKTLKYHNKYMIKEISYKEIYNLLK